MSRKFIVLGDLTSHGGTVISASGAGRMVIDGIPVACVGDMVVCPKKGCRGTFPIIQGASGPDTILDGKAIAREGDVTACGAVLISAGQARATHGPDSGGAGAGAVAAFAEGTASAAVPAVGRAVTSVQSGSGGATEDKETEEYAAQYVIIDGSTGKPVEFGYSYCIKVDDGEAFVDKPAKSTAETRLVQRSEKVAVEMLPPVQLEIGV